MAPVPGKLHVANDVLADMVGHAAMECYGVVGMVAFVFFLVAFYGGCMQKRLYVTMALFTVMVACNFGEANFFSPGGPGGMLWVICVGGGFLIDTLLLHRRRIERMMSAAPPPPGVRR